MSHNRNHRYNRESHLIFGQVGTDTQQDRDELTSSIRGWLASLEDSKWPRGLQYFENASYLQGNHLTRYYYTSDGGLGFHTFGQHDSSQFDHLVAKSADNRLIRPTETVVSMLTGNQPEGRVEPSSDTPEDEDAAALAEITLRLLWEKPLHMPERLREAAMVACICGTVATEIEYGETDVPIVVPTTKIVHQDSVLFKDEKGKPEKVPVEVPDGEAVEMRKDLMARVWTPFHITPDPAATGPHDMVWVARSTFEDLDWIRENFDLRGANGKPLPGYFPENLDGMAGGVAQRYVLYWWAKFRDIIESPQYYQHGGGLAPQTFTSHGGYAPNQTLFTVIDVKPTRPFPRGRTIIFAGGALIYAGDARAWSEKYPWRWHPYAFFSWFKVPGKFWGVPLLSQLVPLQKKINAIDSLVQANRQYMSIGQWLLPKQAKVAEGRISGIPGEHLVYTAAPGFPPPTRVQHAPLPGELLVERDQLLQSIDHIAASGMVGDKVSKSAARAGVILDFLRREKLESQGPKLQDWNVFVETIAQNILIEIQLGLKEEDPELTRRIQVAAREYSNLTVEAFVGSSLRDHHAVKIDVASAVRLSPETQEARALEFFQATGGQVTPEEREGVMKAIHLDKFVKNEEAISVRRARRMLSRIINGRPDAAFPMQGIDNAAAMAPVFQAEIMSDRFFDHDNQARERIVELFDYYSQEAQAEAQRKFQMQLALLQAQKGGGAARSQAAPTSGTGKGKPA